MNKFNNWLLKHVFWIALYLSLSGLFFQAVITYQLDFGAFNKWIYPIFDFNYANFNFFRADVFNFKYNIEEYSYSMRSYLDIVFYLLFLVASIVYKLSKYKEVKVLKFCFSLIFIFTILSFLFQTYLLLIDFESRGFIGLVYVLKAVLMFYICYFYLTTWKSQRTYIDTETMSLPNFKDFTLKRAEWYHRLLHHLLDIFLIISIFSKYIFEFYFGALIEDLGYAVGDRFAATIVFFVFSSFYYLIFEGFFKATPAKYLTQTSVVNLKNETVSFANVLGRTLCRRIPFDAFSFFGKIGWHDSLAYSTVAKQEREPSKFKVVYIVFLIALIALFLYRFIDEMRFF